MIETTRVQVILLDEVGDDVARDEGEDFANAAEWAGLMKRSGVRPSR